MSNIIIVIDDVTKMKVDCIVNAANSGLREGGGVCGAIFAAAGSRELTKACQAIGHCPTGSAVITPGFKLPAKYIIHAVGPRYRDGNSGEPEQLYSCYKKSLELMIENGCSSIAFPLISSGIFGYPKEDAWERALTACVDFIREHKNHNVTINFVVLKESIKQLGESVFSTILGNLPLEAETEPEDKENAVVHEGVAGLKVNVCGHELHIPENYQVLKPLTEDPQDSSVYGMQNEETSCFVMLYPVSARKAMPFGKTEQIARGIHANLGENQGLIEIYSDHTSEGQKYTYTVVKTLKETSGVQYNLTLQITYSEHVLHIQGYFDEIGMTGMRDNMVFELARRQGLVQAGSLDGWMRDPYDPEYKKGVQKNLSENSEYDAQFPDHPLSVLHRFVKTITGFAADEAASGEGDDDSKTPEEILGAVGVDMEDEILPDDAKKELDGIAGKEMKSIGNRLNEIRQLIVQGKPKEAQPLMDALAREADENPMFREDEVSQFFIFREWFEECLYRHMYEPKKDLRRADYPYDEIYSLQGSMYIDLKDLDKAREALKKALVWNPVNPQISFEYAETFKIAGDMENFFEESKKIQKFAIHNPDVARFLRNVGFYFTEVGRYQEAMMCYMRSLFYDRDNKNAENEINYLHQKYGIEFKMPDGKTCQEFSKKYGFALGADNDLLGMMYAYGKHFLDGEQEAGARYCFSLLYELTEDPEIKKILEGLGVEFPEAEEDDGNSGDEDDAENAEAAGSESSDPEGTLYLKNSKADAKGAQTADGFIVFAGSRLFGTPTKSCPDAIKALRKKYKRYVNVDLILQKDLTFTSASQAAGFVLFASANGLANWTDVKGTTLKELMGNRI